MHAPAKIVEGIFSRKEHLSHDIYSFYFVLPQDFHFHAGQYVQISLPHDNPDEEGTTRYFTIASSPTEKELMITTRLRESSFKKVLFHLEKGTKVQFFGPIGTFVLPTV